MGRALTRGEFIARAMRIHRNRYDYSKVYYENNYTEVSIICHSHGEFWQRPKSHLKGAGCPGCFGGVQKTRDQFIQDAIKVHGKSYDYSKVDYIDARTKVIILCSMHGEFLQTPDHHVKGHGCSKCAHEKSHENQKKTKERFIEDAIRVHGNAYDYSKVEYINTYTKVCIICLKHGEFLQSPHSHIDNGSKCPRCVNAGYSQISIQFLNDLAKEWKVEIQHAENKGEYRIEDPELKCYYKLDGYFEQNNKKYAVEFHGNYYHGNPKMYKPDSICKLRRITFGDLYKKTEERMHRIKALGYEVLFIWEQDYKQYLYDKDNEFIEGLFEYYKLL